MNLINNSGLDVSNRFIFFDANTLGFISREKSLFQDIVTVTEKSLRCIDPLVKFEYLRDSNSLVQQKNKEVIINSDIFTHVDSHIETHKKVYDNALVLSNLLSFLKRKNSSGGKTKSSVPDTIDLFLAGRVMLNDQSLLLTCNKKDFPSPIFKVEDIYHYEDDCDGSIKSICLLAFNQEEFLKLADEFNKSTT